MRKLNSDIKFLAILLTMVMLFQTMPLALYAEEEGIVPLDSTDLKYGETYTAEFAYDNFQAYARFPFYNTFDDYENGLISDYAVELESLTETIKVTKNSKDELFLVKVTDDTAWPADYAEYKYVDSRDLSIVDANGNPIVRADMEYGVEYTATWDLVNTSEGNVNSISPYRRVEDNVQNLIPYGSSSIYDLIDVTSEFPSKLSVKFMYEEDVEYEILYVTNEDWPEWLDDYRYLDTWDLNIFAPSLEAQIGSFNASVDGSTIPSGASLVMETIPESEYDSGAYNYYNPNTMGELLGAYDLKIMSNGTEWQPGAGETVTVTMNDPAWGIFPHTDIYILHIHKNADSTKTYQTIGPITFYGGNISFDVDGFSTYYVFKGTTQSITIENGEEEIFYTEPGSVLTFAGNGWGSSTPTLSNPIVAAEYAQYFSLTSTNVVSVQTNAPIGASIKYTATWGNRSCTVEIIVSGRQAIIDSYINHNLVIAIFNQRSGATYPSEPSNNTGGQYLRLSYTDDTEELYGTRYDAYGSSGVTFGTASDFLNSAYMATASTWMYNPQDAWDAAGLVDPTGVTTQQAFVKGNQSTVNWFKVAKTIATYNDGNGTDVYVRYLQENETGFDTINILLTADEAYSIDNYYYTAEEANEAGKIANRGNGPEAGDKVWYQDFTLIPYVIKIQRAAYGGGGITWNVDIAVIRDDSYVLSYDLNLGDYVAESNVFLPNATVYVEDKKDDDDILNAPVPVSGSWKEGYTLRVRNMKLAVSGNLTFQGWCTASAVSADHPLIVPSDTAKVEMIDSTKLYAIWEPPDGWDELTNSIAIGKNVLLTDQSPYGAKVPQFGKENHSRFDFEISFAYDPSATDSTTADYWLKQITFEASVVETAGGSNVIYKESLANLISDTTIANQYKNLIRVNQDTNGNVTSVSFTLGIGEFMYFHNVPVDVDGVEGTDSYTITETITTNSVFGADNDASKYSTSATDLTQKTNTKTATMALTAVNTEVFFNNYYDAPVAGIQISINGGWNDYFIVEVVQQGATPADDVVLATVIVPANSTVIVVTDLLADSSTRYTVREKIDQENITRATYNAWSWRWDTLVARTDIPLEDGNATVEFTPQIGIAQWLSGNARSTD